jgi:hypothetical protein
MPPSIASPPIFITTYILHTPHLLIIFFGGTHILTGPLLLCTIVIPLILSIFLSHLPSIRSTHAHYLSRVGFGPTLVSCFNLNSYCPETSSATITGLTSCCEPSLCIALILNILIRLFYFASTDFYPYNRVSIGYRDAEDLGTIFNSFLLFCSVTLRFYNLHRLQVESFLSRAFSRLVFGPRCSSFSYCFLLL